MFMPRVWTSRIVRVHSTIEYDILDNFPKETSINYVDKQGGGRVSQMLTIVKAYSSRFIVAKK